MGNEPRALEDAKAEALAAFAAIASALDLPGEALTAEQTRASDSLRAAAARHLSAALELVGRANGGEARAAARVS